MGGIEVGVAVVAGISCNGAPRIHINESGDIGIFCKALCGERSDDDADGEEKRAHAEIGFIHAVRADEGKKREHEYEFDIVKSQALSVNELDGERENENEQCKDKALGIEAELMLEKGQHAYGDKPDGVNGYAGIRCFEQR